MYALGTQHQIEIHYRLRTKKLTQHLTIELATQNSIVIPYTH